VVLVTTEQQVSDVVIAALATQDGRGYTIAEVRAANPLPRAYNEVHVYETTPGSARRTGTGSQVQQWQILVRAVGATFDNAREMRNRARLALHEATLTIGGDVVVVEKDASASDEPIGEDDGWYSGLSEYRVST
jgi:hypothetical protein